MTDQTGDPDEFPEWVVETVDSSVRVVVNAWGASEADGGAEGPHVRLFVSRGRDAVFSADRIPDLIDALQRAARWSSS